jgi:hypothetical protein
MALVSIDIDTSALTRAAAALGRLPAQVERDVDHVVRHRLSAAEGDFRTHTPRSTPPPWPVPAHTPMREMWRTQMFGAAEGAVGNLASYALFLFEPTVAHTIEARNAQALHFQGAGGTEVFARRVEHPGTQPNAPLVQALERQVGLAEADLAALGLHAVTTVAAQIQRP